jgi:hypothetical protein
MPKYQLYTAAEVASKNELRSFTGPSSVVTISQGDDAGTFRHDESDLTSADDDLDLIVDYLGRRWARLGIGSLSFTQVGGDAVKRPAEEKLQEIFSGRDFGAVADDSTNDATAVQAAQDGASTRYTLDFGNGVYRVRPGAVSFDYFGNLTGNLCYRAVEIDKSDLTIRGGRFHISSRSSVLVGDVQPAFATDKNAVVGTLENITFDGVELNTENDADASNSNQRGPYMTGVRGLQFINTKALSTGNRRGYYAHIQNCENVLVTGHYHRKVTGGFNFRYCKNVAIANCVFDDFSEAIDFDGVSWRATLSNLTFRSRTRTAQCMDLNSLVDFSVNGVVVDTVGNIATVTYKTTTPDNYADYVAGVAPTTLTPTARGTISNVSGQAIGDADSASFVIGHDWAAGSHAGYYPVSEIVLENISLKDVSRIQVYEAIRLTLRNVYLQDVLTGAASVEGINMESATGTDDKLTYSDLDVTLENVEINGCDRGAVSLARPSRAVVRGLKVRGSDTLSTGEPDLRITSLEYRAAVVSLDGLDVGDVTINGDSTAIATWGATTAYPKNKVIKNGSNFYVCTTAGTSAGAGGPTGTTLSITDGTCVWRYLNQPFSVTWGRSNRVAGAITLQGDVAKYMHGRTDKIEGGSVVATGTVRTEPITVKRRCYLARVGYTLTASVGVDAVNYRAISLKSVQSGAAAQNVAQVTSVAGWSANTEIDGGTFTASRAILNPGDAYYLEFTSAGTGQALTDVTASIEVLEC